MNYIWLLCKCIYEVCSFDAHCIFLVIFKIYHLTDFKCKGIRVTCLMWWFFTSTSLPLHHSLFLVPLSHSCCLNFSVECNGIVIPMLDMAIVLKGQKLEFFTFNHMNDRFHKRLFVHYRTLNYYFLPFSISMRNVKTKSEQQQRQTRNDWNSTKKKIKNFNKNEKCCHHKYLWWLPEHFKNTNIWF